MLPLAALLLTTLEVVTVTAAAAPTASTTATPALLAVTSAFAEGRLLSALCLFTVARVITVVAFVVCSFAKVFGRRRF